MTRLSDAPAPYGTPRKAGIALDFEDNLGSVTRLPVADSAKAARNVAGRARDAADARLLLDVLGLLPATPEESQ